MPIVVFAAAFVTGILLSSKLFIPSELVILWSLGILALGIAWRGKPSIFLVGVALFACGLGILRYQPLIAIPEGNSLVLRNGVADCSIRGETVETLGANGTTLIVRSHFIRVGKEGNWEEVTGDILVFTNSYSTYSIGDELELSGAIRAIDSIESQSFRAYLERHNVASTMQYPRIALLDKAEMDPLSNLLSTTRKQFSSILAQNLPEPQASVAQGLLIGERKNLPSDINDAFVRTGTSHILAISGFNITMIVSFTATLGSFLLGRRKTLIFTAIIVLAYMGLVGATPSVVRAVIMGLLVILARHFGRQTNSLNFLALAALAMCIQDPKIIWDAGFQLSFAATIGLLVIAPILQQQILLLLCKVSRNETLGQKRLIYTLTETTATTLGATAITLPIIASNFGGVPLLSPVVNLLVSPIPSIIIVLSFILVIVGTVVPPLSFIIAWPTSLLTALFVGTVRLFSSWNHLYVTTLAPDDISVVLYYSALLAAIKLAGQPTKPENRPQPWPSLLITILNKFSSLFREMRHPDSTLWSPPSLIVLGCIALLPWPLVFLSPPGRYSVSVLDVSQGNSVLVSTPSRQTVLIDGGPSPTSAIQQIDNRLPFYRRKLDVVVLTHPHEDHLAGLIEVINRYEIGTVIEGPAEDKTNLYENWTQLLASRRIPHLRVKSDLLLPLGSDANLSIFSIEPQNSTGRNTNDQTLIVRFESQNFSVLLPADIDKDMQQTLVNSDRKLDSTILLIPHHGSESSFNENFLSVVRPQVAVISVGRNNTYGHPSPVVLENLTKRGIKSYRTDFQGSIDIESTGTTLQINHER